MSSEKPPFETRILEESEFPSWRTFVDSAPSGSVYSYPEYLDVLCRVTGGSFRILAVFKGESIHGGIALFERSGSGGQILSGRLLLYYNGIVLRDFGSKFPSRKTAGETAVLRCLEEALSGKNYAHTQIRNRHPVSDVRVFTKAGWSASPSYSLLLDIRRPEEAFERIEQNQRRLIKRCSDSGASMVADEDFASFFELHRGTHLRKGAPLYLPADRFHRYFSDLNSQGLCRLFHARLPDGRPIASQLVLLGGHPVTHTAAAAADPEFLNLGSTPFLRWKVCEQLAAEGYQGNDLTDASLNQVTRFKSQLGAELVTNLVLSQPDRIRYRTMRSLRRAIRLARGGIRKVLRVSNKLDRT
jgi:hypothetical protein